MPTGTVTMLFTDIEGSTRLLKQLGEVYGGVLAEHRRILRASSRSSAGREMDTQGDAFFFAFDRARNAVGAAVAAQRALAAADWPGARAARCVWVSTPASRRSATRVITGWPYTGAPASAPPGTAGKFCSPTRPANRRG